MDISAVQPFNEGLIFGLFKVSGPEGMDKAGTLKGCD
jgi:hypothetical protein